MAHVTLNACYFLSVWAQKTLAPFNREERSKRGKEASVIIVSKSQNPYQTLCDGNGLLVGEGG